MRKAITGLAIAALVAGVALVAVSLSQTPSVLAQETEDQIFNQPLGDVLDGLVEDEVITADQRDKIASAFEEQLTRFGRGFRGTPHLETVAEVLGMDVDDLAAQLRDGSTIANIAGDKTKAVTDALVAEQKARIDEAVADGRLTEEKAQEVRAAVEDQVGAMVSGEHKNCSAPFGMDHFHGRGDFNGLGFRGGFSLDTIAEKLGLTVDDLHQQLADGSSLADIAAQSGVDTQAIVDAVLADLDKQLTALVADQRLTQERADAIREGSAGMIESMINGDMPGFGFKFPGGEGFRGHGMPGPGGFFGTPEDDVNGTGTSA
ncbi:MAG: hypothetical protein OEM81_07710 [Acidimicrobiia bacterium]|nr:hypothetical protein [Acidimicrobiia bacterium]MDH3397699.1 hypothetical protein [Acidimicrobiia bacterium]